MWSLIIRPPWKISLFPLTRPYQKEMGRSLVKTFFLPQRRLMNSKIWRKSHSMTKPTKWPMRPAKTQIRLGIHPLWSVFAVRIKKSWDFSYSMSGQQRLFRLGGCTGWSESSLSAQEVEQVRRDLVIMDNFAYFSIKTCSGYSLKCLAVYSNEYPQHGEAILSTNNICFMENWWKLS